MPTLHLKNQVTLSIALLIAIVAIGTGCSSESSNATTSSSPSTSSAEKKIALISITSDPLTNPQAVNMGLIFASFCADEGYEVSIFFNVKGTKLPTKSFDSNFKFNEHEPMMAQLIALSKRGVQLHVCPVCMKDLNIAGTDLIGEAFVTTKPKLFANLGASTMVMTY